MPSRRPAHPDVLEAGRMVGGDETRGAAPRPRRADQAVAFDLRLDRNVSPGLMPGAEDHPPATALRERGMALEEEFVEAPLLGAAIGLPRVDRGAVLEEPRGGRAAAVEFGPGTVERQPPQPV